MSDIDTGTSDEDMANVPDVKICEARCKEFAELTSTDTACAQFFLQDTEWDVSKAVNAYFDTLPTSADFKTPASTSRPKVAATLINLVGSVLSATEPKPIVTGTGDGHESTDSRAKSDFRFLSWNVDGLGEYSREQRINEICVIIKRESPLVAHLQEVTPYVYSCLKKQLSNDYKLIAGNADPQTDLYYTMTLLKKDDAVTQESHKILEFPDSTMGRTLLFVKVRVCSIPFLFLNSHLESTGEYTNERKRQLSICFKQFSNYDARTTVIFAGDLNLRDKELDAIGGLHASVEDLWIATGRREELQYTWDAQRNGNISGCGYARCRFDRIYLRQASPSRLTIKHFGFVGIEKIASCGRFPSDHWGLLASFETH